MKEIKNLKFKIKNSKRGFSLVETLVATFVLMFAITGPLLIVSRGVFYSLYAKDQVTSFYLAQEAIEYIRNRRDVTTITGNVWNTFKQNNGAAIPQGIHDCLTNYNADGCTVDVTTDSITACTGACAPLRQNSTSGLYGYQASAGWNVSPYTRIIKMYNEPLSDPLANEMRIEVEIRWQDGELQKSFNLRENIFNWQ